jgi:hypothetical protein
MLSEAVQLTFSVLRAEATKLEATGMDVEMSFKLPDIE